MQKYASGGIDQLCLFCKIILNQFYVLSKMMLKCTLMKEQINNFKIKSIFYLVPFKNLLYTFFRKK